MPLGGPLYFVARCCTVSRRGKGQNRTPIRTQEDEDEGTQRAGGAQPPHRQFLVLFVASVFVIDGLVGDRGLLAIKRAQREYDTAAATVARQRAENARLREEARRLREDPGAIEEIARRELGLIRPGEKVFIIKDVPASQQPVISRRALRQVSGSRSF